MRLKLTSGGAPLRQAARAFAQLMEADARVHAKAAKAGVGRAAEGLKTSLRGQVTGAGLGRKLANAWRARVYPRSGESLDAAGFVWTNAPAIVRAFDEGVTIRSRDGFWLAVPTPSAPKHGVGGKRISPSNWPDHRFGPLRFVYRGRGRPGLLVADALRASISRKTGELRGFRTASERARASGRGLTTVVMFVLVPQVRLRKRLDVERAANEWADRVPELVNAAVSELEQQDPVVRKYLS